MPYDPSRPVIVQSDRTILLEADHSLYEEARDQLVRFAELEKSPEHVHTYRISPLSLWNAAATGMTAAEILDALAAFSKFDLPGNVRTEILEQVNRYGRLKLIRDDGRLLLTAEDPALIAEVWHNRKLQPYLLAQLDARRILVDPGQRGHVKMALIRLGFPPEDLAGYVAGSFLDIRLSEKSRSGAPFTLRQYQRLAAEAFHQDGSVRGGSGVIVLPCGAGKTIVGLAAMGALRCSTLILSFNTIAVRQWIHEMLDKTNLSPAEVGEYTGDRKEIRPVTVTTYQILTYRPQRVNPDTGEVGEFPHFALFNERDWGLIIYDEVHLLPAPVFRATAEIQARRRLGLTATLVREDGRETDVFGLIGPKKYDVPWKELEREGWIATAECHEIRLDMDGELRMAYAVAEDREKYRIAATNPGKLDVIHELAARHRDENVLVIGQYIDQLTAVASRLGAPLITGQASNREREKLYGRFRSGDLKLLVVSKVANFAVDLPEASVAIQISGTFGSRQEEAQRLGRILRPKRDGTVAHFYSLVTRETRDQDFAVKRQLFLTEQGYRYTIADASEILGN
ncbi:MAG: DEAD/DEAH box helicase [Chloroflexi bacterium]|nr:DEAD/DEAH box helicase [Chloroflexota bacterium]